MPRMDPLGLHPSVDDGDVMTTVGGVAAWAPAPGGAEVLDDLTDVDTTTTTPTLGDSLVWDGTEWVPGRGVYREVLMASGVTPPEPLTTTDESDWLYGEAPL